MSLENSDEIRRLLLTLANENGLSVKDFSDSFRRIEKNERLVFLNLRPSHLLPAYQAEITINPTRGSSKLVVYADEPGVPKDIQTLLERLMIDFKFTLRSDVDGLCPSESQGSE